MDNQSTDPHYHRRTIRLAEFDYAQAGGYFITLVTDGRTCVFGEIKDGNITLSAAGMLVEREWHHLAKRFPGLELDAFQVMPNHIHGILFLTSPNTAAEDAEGVHHGGPPSMQSAATLGPSVSQHAFGRKVTPGSVSAIVRAYKSSVAVRYNRMHVPVHSPLWQRNYYEHIIRSTESLDRIRAYIMTNPQQWADDQENPNR